MSWEIPSQPVPCVLHAEMVRTTHQAAKYWIPELKLSFTDRNALVNRLWLMDKVINAAQILLKETYPHIGGLQTTARSEVLAFDVETGEFVQIMNVSNSHYITIANFGCPPAEIDIFDSLPNVDLPKRNKATLICIPTSKISLNFQAVQEQVGSNDCGAFAIAFATSLCE